MHISLIFLTYEQRSIPVNDMKHEILIGEKVPGSKKFIANYPKYIWGGRISSRISGVITLPTQTMHYNKGNPSKSPYICIVSSPQYG